MNCFAQFAAVSLILFSPYHYAQATMQPTQHHGNIVYHYLKNGELISERSWDENGNLIQ